jgi:hypothetical protein
METENYVFMLECMNMFYNLQKIMFNFEVLNFIFCFMF